MRGARRWIDPLGWLSAVLLFMLERAFGIVAAIVVPRLIDLLDESPRLAMFGFLCLIVSPGVMAGCLHRVIHRAMDRVDMGGAAVHVSSTWAGAFAWLVMFGTNLLAMFVMLVLVPPPPNDAHAALFATVRAAVLGEGAFTALHAVVWIAIAAQLFSLERVTRRH